MKSETDPTRIRELIEAMLALPVAELSLEKHTLPSSIAAVLGHAANPDVYPSPEWVQQVFKAFPSNEIFARLKESSGTSSHIARCMLAAIHAGREVCTDMAMQLEASEACRTKLLSGNGIDLAMAARALSHCRKPVRSEAFNWISKDPAIFDKVFERGNLISITSTLAAFVYANPAQLSDMVGRFMAKPEAMGILMTKGKHIDHSKVLSALLYSNDPKSHCKTYFQSLRQHNVAIPTLTPAEFDDFNLWIQAQSAAGVSGHLRWDQSQTPKAQLQILIGRFLAANAEATLAPDNGGLKASRSRQLGYLIGEIQKEEEGKQVVDLHHLDHITAAAVVEGVLQAAAGPHISAFITGKAIHSPNADGHNPMAELVKQVCETHGCTAEFDSHNPGMMNVPAGRAAKTQTSMAPTGHYLQVPATHSKPFGASTVSRGASL